MQILTKQFSDRLFNLSLYFQHVVTFKTILDNNKTLTVSLWREFLPMILDEKCEIGVESAEILGEV